MKTGYVKGIGLCVFAALFATIVTCCTRPAPANAQQPNAVQLRMVYDGTTLNIYKFDEAPGVRCYIVSKGSNPAMSCVKVTPL